MSTLLRLTQIQKGRFPASRSTIYRLIKKGLFPKPRKLPGTNINVWDEEEIPTPNNENGA